MTDKLDEIIKDNSIRPNRETFLEDFSLDDQRDNKFTIVISDEVNSDAITYAIDGFEHPSVTLARIEAPHMLHETGVPSNTVKFSDAGFSFDINTHMTLYYYVLQEMFNASTNHTYKRDINPKYQRGEGGTKSMMTRRKQITLMIYDNNNNLIRKILYRDCFFTSLGGLRYGATSGEPGIQLCEVRFSLNWFDFEE